MPAARARQERRDAARPGGAAIPRRIGPAASDTSATPPVGPVPRMDRRHPVAARTTAMPERAKPSRPPQTLSAVDQVDTSFLETLIGYNARRAALAIIDVFLQRMAVYGLRPVDFSVLSLITHNPGITSRQICTVLAIQPPNLVSMVQTLVQRGLVERRAHPSDRRAQGLYLTPEGEALMHEAERTASTSETESAQRLTPAERRTLIRLLKKVYLPQ